MNQYRDAGEEYQATKHLLDTDGLRRAREIVLGVPVTTERADERLAEAAGLIEAAIILYEFFDWLEDRIQQSGGLS